MSEFNKWMSEFKETIFDFSYFTDFKKVYRKVEEIKVEISILNSLIKSKNIENDFISIVRKYKNVVSIIPLLIAVREKQIKILEDDVILVYDFEDGNEFSDDQIKSLVKFMRETGLFELLEEHLFSSLFDYIIGVEVGLDSNARKNRTGLIMEDIVNKNLELLKNANHIEYYSQMSTKKINELWGLDLSCVFETNDDNKKANKVFDFVVKTENSIYAIEVNYYSKSGSKLNEVSRSYQNLHSAIRKIDGFEFIWITDGQGWFSAKNNLEETFDVVDNVLNLEDLFKGKLKEILK